MALVKEEYHFDGQAYGWGRVFHKHNFLLFSRPGNFMICQGKVKFEVLKLSNTFL